MADLPADRVAPGGPAFTSIGIDYFSPITAKRGRGQERRYLPLLRQRTKWQQPHRNVTRDDLVIVTDKQLPRNEWSTGQVMDVIVGQDGLVRTAIIKTRAGTFSRPVVKLCVLEEVAFAQ